MGGHLLPPSVLVFLRITSVWNKNLLLSDMQSCMLMPVSSSRHASCMLSCFSCVLLFVTLWTVACQAPLSMGFSRPEHWSGLPCYPPGDLPVTGIEPMSLMSPALAGGFFTTSTTCEALSRHLGILIPLPTPLSPNGKSVPKEQSISRL